jgi:hypothetical protein
VNIVDVRTIAALLFPTLWATAHTTLAEEKPPVPFAYGAGFDRYQKLCAEYHGEWVDGTDKGPPLMHG